MNEVIIRIIDTTNNVEGDLDLTNFNDFPLAINKGIVNLDNLKERTGTFTKMFKVPNSKNNTNLLSNVDNINSRKDYRDCLNRKPCIILVNNNPVEHGFVQVVKAFNDFKGGYFELVFYGNNIDWVKDAAELNVNTITWTNNTEQYRQSTIDNLNALTVSSTDIAYPYISRGGNQLIDSASVEDFIPCIYLKSIITKCFSSIGYKIESSFIDEVDTLVCDLNLKFQQSKIAIDNSRVRASMTIPTVVNVDPNTTKRIIFNNDITSPNEDENNYYNPTTGIYTIPTTGTYLITVLLNDFNLTTGDAGQLRLVKNGTSTTSIGTGDEVANEFIYSAGDIEHTFQVTLVLNDELSFYVNPDDVSDNLVSFASGTYFKIQLTSEIKKNDTFSISSMIPDDVKFLDILNDFTRMFNIYYWTDVKTKTVYFEPRDVFFNSKTTALDWSSKLDTSNGYEVDYVSSYKRTVNFSYKKPSKDGYLKEWKDLNRREYGEYNHKLPDRFNEGTTNIKLDFFSATYAHKALEVTPTPREAFTTLKIWNEFKSSPETPDTRIIDYNPRIFFFKNGGQLSSDTYERAISKFSTSSTTIPYGIFETYYNIEPQINLNFTNSLKKDGTTADIGLFDRYYSKMFKNIEEGGRIIAYFDLSPTDIQNLDFRELIYLDGDSSIKGYYLVEKVIDYNPLTSELTKVSLFKFEDLGSVSIDDTQTGNNDSDTDDGLTPPTLQPIYVENGALLIEVYIENPITGLIEPVYK